MLQVLQPLRRRLPLVFAAVLALVVGGVGTAAYLELRSGFLAAAGDRAQGVATRLSRALDESVARLTRDAVSLAADPAARAALARPVAPRAVAAFGALFARENQRTPQLVALEVVGRDGGALMAADSAHGVTAGVLASLGPRTAGVVRVPPPPVGEMAIAGGFALFDVSAPLLGPGGDTLGFLVATRRVERVSASAVADADDADATVLLGNADGSVWTRVAGPPDAATPLPVDAPWARRRRASDDVAAAARVESAPWQVVVQIPRASALQPARRARSIIVAVGLVLVAAAVAFMWRVMLRLTSPLLELTDAARDVARGQYGRRITGGRHGEVGEVLAAFNQMAERVEAAARERVERTAQLETALRALRDSESRYRLLVELSPDGVLLSRGGRVLYANPAAAALLGASSGEELIGRSTLDLTVAEERQEVAARLAASEYQGVATGLTDRTVRRLDGSIARAETVGIPFTVDGQPTVLVIVRDVTERRTAEEALREIEARYRHVTMNVPGMVYRVLVPPEGPVAFTLVSDGARDLLGVEPAELLADMDSFLRLIHPDDIASFHASGQAALAALTPGGLARWHWEGRFVLPSGEEKWVEAAARVSRRDDGVAVSDGLILDVTERHRAVQRLRDSELRFHMAARATRDIIYDWDVVNDTLFWGGTMNAAFGYAPGEIEATNGWWILRIHPGDTERVLASLDDAMDTGCESWSAEYRFRCRDGSYAEVLDRAYLVRDEAGRLRRLVGSMSDLTERKTLEEQLRQAQKMEAVGQLAGGVAHDFNNILTAVTSYCDLLLEEGASEEERRGWLVEIRNGANRAATLTRQLLAFSRRQLLQPRTLDLNRTVRDVEQMLRRLVREDIALSVALEPALWPVRADPGQVEQVLINLVVNARDAMPDGGRLTIATENVTLDEPEADARRRVQVPPGEYVRIVVRDTGIGMDEATKAHIFEPFFTTKEPGKGTGLGLSTVYGIVKQSGGYICCTTARGAGTVFRLYLPRVDAAAEPADRDSRPVPVAAARPGCETVLLVEDDDAVRDVTRQILTKRGYVVLQARDGAEALALCGSGDHEIDLIVSDMVMPEMSGPELGRQVRERHPDTALLFMSGYTREAALRQSFLEPGTAFIEKPFTAQAFAARVREVLDQRALAALAAAG